MLTRRKLAATVFSSAAAIAMAQTPAPPAIPANPDEELKAARDRIKANGDLLAKQAVPMDTEPAVTFKV